jgi:Domain of unknown function (DUF4189)
MGQPLGGVATGESANGAVLGVAVDMKNQRVAEKNALKSCRSQGGGKSCAVDISYHDQCAVMAWGNGYSHFARAATISRAKNIAMAACRLKSAGCEVYYSNCVYPVRTR